MASNMRLITEVTFDIKPIMEGEGDARAMYIQGVFAQAELLNRNNRVYPKKILEGAVSEYIKDYVQRSRALGELNHPAEPTVNPERACIKIESLVWEGNNVIGKAKVLSNRLGQDVAALLRDGVQLGVSTRGLGSVQSSRDGSSIVEDDYQIRAIDVVHNPSGIDCFVDGILENVEFYYDRGLLKARDVERMQKNVKRNDVQAIAEDFGKFVGRVLTT